MNTTKEKKTTKNVILFCYGCKCSHEINKHTVSISKRRKNWT